MPKRTSKKNEAARAYTRGIFSARSIRAKSADPLRPALTRRGWREARAKADKVGLNQILIFCTTLIVLTLSIFNITFFSIPGGSTVLGVKTTLDSNQVLHQKKLFWENFLRENPSYLAGWIELAKIEVQLENIEEAKFALQKAVRINPNSVEVERLSEVLGI